MAKDIHHPVPEVHTCGLAASQQGVKYGGIFSSVMVTTKKVIFSAQRQASQVIFRQIIIYAVSAVEMVPGQPVVYVIAIFQGLSYRAFGHNLGVFAYQPFLEGDHDRIGMALSEGRPFIMGEVPVIGFPFNFIEETDLLKGISSPVPVILQGLFKLSAVIKTF